MSVEEMKAKKRKKKENGVLVEKSHSYGRSQRIVIGY
jgi:hypothetical protein